MTLQPDKNAKQQLISFFEAAIMAVSGKQAVIDALTAMPTLKPTQVIAVGKAASDMALGALEILGPVKTLIVTKYHHSEQVMAHDFADVTIIESGHPVPDENSLRAGRKLIEWVGGSSKSDCLLLLISGGASAVAESLPDCVTLEQWQTLTQQMIASGKTIGQINQKRKQVSLIKDGKLLQGYKGDEVVVLAVSDVEGDDISTIGSGIGDANRTRAKTHIKLVATNKKARHATATAARKAGYEVILNQESLYDDVYLLSVKLGALLRDAQKGVYIFGGEPTINLPDNPGNGGRNQSLALALAKEIAGQDNITVLVAGTDGSDGPTDAAGAIIDGGSFRHPQAAQWALEQANAGDYLRQTNDIFITGPTGTNVMDLVIALVE